MKRGHFFVVGLVAALALALSACGGSATSPSATGVTLRGVAMGVPASAGVNALSGASATAGGSAITVTVQENPSLTTTISGNGTFELKGLPPGTITLVFSSNGVTLGTVTITSVPTEAEIDLVIRISNTNVIVVKIEINGSDETETQTEAARTCLIAGGTVGSGIELEGSVSSPTSPVGASSFTMSVNGQRSSGTVSVDYSGASFTCAGIKGACDATLITTGRKVHVRGNLTSCSTADAVVKATQVKFQH